MRIWINGKDEDAKGAPTLRELVAACGLKPETVVVEHNARIVRREEWPSVVLRENDRIEIVSFVGGG